MKDKFIYNSYLIPAYLKRFPRKLAVKILLDSFLNKSVGLTYFSNARQKKIFDLIDVIKGEVDMLLSHAEAYQIFKIAENIQKIEGEVAEVGVYQGGSAKLICEAVKGVKPVHLFDTFEGLPETGEFDGLLKKGDYNASFDSVKNYLKDYKNIYFYKGLFPETAAPVKSKLFSFVHLDVDTYKSTVESLDFVYPRINKGGIMLSHDYSSGGEGETAVKKAFDEFFADKPEPVLELAGSQCMIVKL